MTNSIIIQLIDIFADSSDISTLEWVRESKGKSGGLAMSKMPVKVEHQNELYDNFILTNEHTEPQELPELILFIW